MLVIHPFPRPDRCRFRTLPSGASGAIRL